MRITKIRLENWRNVESAEIDLERVNVFVGRNGVGKSSLQAAIEYALTGRCRWTDRRGAGAQDLIRHGAKQAVIELEIERLGKLTRTVPNSLQIDGWSGSVTVQQEALYRWLGANEQTISALLNAADLAVLPPQEQRDLLLGLVGEAITPDSVVDALTAQDIELAQAAKVIMPQDVTGAALLDRLERAAKGARKEAKAAAKALKERLEAIGLVSPEEKARLDQAKAALASLQAERDELYRAIVRQEERVATRRQMAEMRQRLVEERDSIQASLGLPPETTETEAAIAKTQESLATVRSRIEEVTRRLERVSGEAQAARSIQERLAGMGRECPLAPGLLTCPHAPDTIQDAIRGMADKAEAMAKFAAETARELDELRSQERRLSDRLLELQTKLQTELAQQATYREKLDRLGKLNAQLSAFGDDAGPDSMDDLAETERLRELDAKISELRSTIAAAEALANKAAEAAAIRRALADAERRADLYERLVRAVGPDGLQKTILADRLEGILERVNSRLGDLTAKTLKVQWNADRGLLVMNTRTGAILPSRLLSASEGARVGVALHRALVSLTGLGLFVIDETEHMDPENRLRLTNALLADQEIRTAIVLSAIGDVRPRDPGIPGLGLYVVENGQFVRLGREAA